jgi:hypothetical protein
VRRHVPILAILAIAAVARFWAIDFCLPSTLCRPDEEAVASISTYFFTRNFNPHFFDWPSFFMYEVSVGLIPLFKLGNWLGWYRGEKHFVEMMRLDPAPVFLTARLLSAAAGVATVWFVYRIARRMRDETTGLIAALFLALAFLHARDSHFGVTDITATFLIMVSFFFTARSATAKAVALHVIEKSPLQKGAPYDPSDVRRAPLYGVPKDLIWAAAFAGLATATKYNAVLILLPLLATVITSPKRIAMLLGVAFAAFFVASPFVILDYTNSMTALQQISDHLSAGHGVNLGRGWSVHLTTSLRYGLGIPLLATGIAGLVVAIYRRPREGVVLALFPIVYYLTIGAGYTVFARYILPVIPFLCIGAAIAVTEVARRWLKPSPSIAFQTIAWVVALIIVAPSAWSIFQFDRLLARTDSRVMVEDWVKQHYPNGAVIGQMLRLSNHLYFIPEVLGQPSKYQPLLVDEVPGEPDVLVVPSSLYDRGYRPPQPVEALMLRYTKAYWVDTFDPKAGDVIFDRQDEFYLPLAGFEWINRPGPSFVVYIKP